MSGIIRFRKLTFLEVIKENGGTRSKNKDLESVIGSKGYVSSILSGRREITLKMAKKLKVFFQIPAELFCKPKSIMIQFEQEYNTTVERMEKLLQDSN